MKNNIIKFLDYNCKLQNRVYEHEDLRYTFFDNINNFQIIIYVHELHYADSEYNIEIWTPKHQMAYDLQGFGTSIKQATIDLLNFYLDSPLNVKLRFLCLYDKLMKELNQ